MIRGSEPRRFVDMKQLHQTRVATYKIWLCRSFKICRNIELFIHMNGLAQVLEFSNCVLGV